MTKIEAPTNCPSCNSLLEEVNYLLFCRSQDCGHKVLKLIEHFAKSLKIKGLGPATISKLGISSLEELYALAPTDIAGRIGSEVLSAKLVDEISRSKTAPLNVLLPAFSIPLIGNSASAKLSKVCTNIEEIDYDLCRSAGLGDKAASNLCTWLEKDFHQVSGLPFSFKFNRPEKPEQSSTPQGVICISGKLSSYKNKAEAKSVLEGLGFTVKTSLTKDVTYLVNESGVESAKSKKARQSGIQIIPNISEFIGEL